MRHICTKGALTSLLLFLAAAMAPVADSAPLPCFPPAGMPINYCDSFFYLDNRGENGTGRAFGERVTLGFLYVAPQDGTIDTTWEVSAHNNSANIHQPLNHLPFTANPYFHNQSYVDRPNRRDDWTLQVKAVHQVGVVTVQDDFVDLPSLKDKSHLPVISASALLDNKTGQMRTTWELPAHVPHDAVRLSVLDRAHSVIGGTAAVSDVLVTILLPAGTTTVDLRDYIELQSGHPYTIEIGLADTKDDSFNARLPNLFALSRAFFDVVAPEAGTDPMYLPTSTSDGSFRFSLPVARHTPVRIDPLVAVGYEYMIGEGDPLFASVRLPDIGDGDGYKLCLWEGSAYDCSTLLDADELFTFVGGTDRFKVLDIDAGLDPTDPTAFVTELTFVDDGRFTGTQTPILAEVPEPGTLALLGAGLAMLPIVRRRRLAA